MGQRETQAAITVAADLHACHHFTHAAASDVIHFSFEKRDSVTCSTVCGRLPISEEVLFRGELVSFAVGSAVLDAAREQISDLEREEEAAEQVRAQARVEAAERSAADAAARAEAAASASSAKYEEISRKRTAAMEGEAQRKQQRGS